MCVCEFNKYLPCAYHVLGTVPDAGDSTMGETGKNACSHRGDGQENECNLEQVTCSQGHREKCGPRREGAPVFPWAALSGQPRWEVCIVKTGRR